MTTIHNICANAGVGYCLPDVPRDSVERRGLNKVQEGQSNRGGA